MKAEFEYKITDLNEAKLVKVEGVIDTSNTDNFRLLFESLTQITAPRLIMDFSQLGYLNSTAFAVLFGCHNTCQSKGGILMIFGLSEKLANIMQILGLSNILNLFKTQDEAFVRLSELNFQDPDE